MKCGGALQAGVPCGGERLLLMFDRWRKLLKAFHNEKKKQYDISKIPDIYDSAKYDAIHNFHLPLDLQPVYQVCCALASTCHQGRLWLPVLCCGASTAHTSWFRPRSTSMDCHRPCCAMLCCPVLSTCCLKKRHSRVAECSLNRHQQTQVHPSTCPSTHGYSGHAQCMLCDLPSSHPGDCH